MILDDILEHKRREVAEACERVAPDEMAARASATADPTRGFRRSLALADSPAVIAEIKRRSPSKGEIRPDFDPVACARDYARGGAAALSVLTDAHFFGGELATLGRVRAVVDLALLRKDFVIDAYQVDEARAAGADAVLLIAGALEPDALIALRKQASLRGLDALIEVHDEAQLEVALAAQADWIGVNNRDLRTFEVDLGVTERLAARLPADRDILLVAESGISRFEDIERLQRAGARAFLVGEALMREPDLVLALERLRRSS